ncbi:hypothetical protein N0V82_002282 [Gnomoniopsis sp. IMI 355080]|nr:hypothetical protein N0V82_002282 [Gnomoniopsis sp. IMI 355080]
MAPVYHQVNYLKPSENIRRSGVPSDASLDVGQTVGIAIGIAFVCSFALATFVYYYAARRKRSMTMRARRGQWTGAMEEGVYGTRALNPRTGLDRVLSMFSSKGRRPVGQQDRSSRYLSDEYSKPRQLPDKELNNLRESAVELDGGQKQGNAAFRRAEANNSLGPIEDTRAQVGLATSQTSACNSERSVASEGTPASSSAGVKDLGITMPSTIKATAAPAAWHRKRAGPPPPLTIEPPGMHSQCPMDPYSAYSTYTTSQSPYEYCSINVPSVPALPPQIPNDGFGTRFPYDGEDSLRSASSTRSSHPLQYPPSPQTPGSIPSISRSESGAQETQPLAPPTPTYSLPRSQPSPQRAAIIEATHFECLGPLPDHISIPSPPHFRTQHQQQQDPFLTPRVHTPEDRSPVGQESTTTTAATGETIHVFVQDPLLHESNPFRHEPSPVHPTFDRAHSVHAHSLQDSDLSKTRRESADSLGSNFTVEEEARIQEQIVRNLDALDKERVMGEMDIVHIPQVSERRYSWED